MGTRPLRPRGRVPIIAAGTALDVWCVWNSWVRNPIYLAALLIVLEEAWLFMSQALLAYAAAMAVLFHLFITGYEQPTLRSRCGSTYLEYQRPVIPSVSNEPMIATLARVTANHPVPSFGRRKVRRWDGHDGGGGDRRASSGGRATCSRPPAW